MFNLEGANPKSGEVLGGIAQLVEHLLCKQGVIGSSPIISTKKSASEPSRAGRMDRSEGEKGEREFPFRVRDEGKPGVANRRSVAIRANSSAG